MSAILGVFGSERPLTDDQVNAMLDAMRARGATERVEVFRDSGVVMVVGRYEWELADGFADGVLIASDDRVVVAADASVYYRDQLRTALAEHDITPQRDSPAHYILAAWRAWGPAFVDTIDSDLACIIYDRHERRVLCARDFSGKRPLHYALLGRELVAASTIGGVLAHPRCPHDLNLDVIAGTAAGLIFSAGPQTCYTAIQSLPNAHRLTWSNGRAAEPERFWEPPIAFGASRLSFEEGAEHLRDLLAEAALQRLDRTGTNTVWMSGGWDSSSVFAAAKYATRRADLNCPIRPVSISYPMGDPGREDEWIQSIADRWQESVHWIDIADIPFLDRESERAAARDEPYSHLYVKWNSALAAGSRTCGSRIALDGNGGDQLFANSDVFLADLARRGRWLTLAREWKSRPRGGFRSFFSTVIQPNLPTRVLRLATVLRNGRRLRHYLERPLPEWVRADFASRHHLVEMDQAFLTRNIAGGHAAREIDWMFTCQFVSRAFSLLGSFALEYGVELRSPLSDRRVVEFALSRPWWERSSGTETKRLLRRAMAGLLPDEVLAPRARRTGITGGYSHLWMRDFFPGLVDETLQRSMVLADLGIVDPAAFKRATAAYARQGGSGFHRVNLFYTLQTELWLRARSEPQSHRSKLRENELATAGAA